MTPLAIVVALAVGYVLGRLHQRHRASLLAENNHWLGEDIEAIKGADLDADVAAERRERLSGEQPAVDEFEIEPFMADSGYRPPQRPPCGVCGTTGPICDVEAHARRQCSNGQCKRHAVFAWETDGFPFAACNRCVSLWFEDGLPDHVVRLGDPFAGVALEPYQLAAEISLPAPVEATDDLGQLCEYPDPDDEVTGLCGQVATGWVSGWSSPEGPRMFLCGPHYDLAIQDDDDTALGVLAAARMATDDGVRIPIEQVAAEAGLTDGLNAWAEAVHRGDDDTSDGPRSVPGGRQVSD